MRRIPLLVAAVVVLVALGVLSSIVTQGFAELARAEEEHRRYSEEKARLEHRVHDLQATLRALRNDSRAVESMARSELGWVRPGERVLVLQAPTPAPPPVESAAPRPTPLLRLGR